MMTNMQPYTLHLQASDEALSSLFLALERDPKLPRRVFEAIWSEVLTELRNAYPRTLPFLDDSSWLLGRLERVFVGLLHPLLADLAPADAEPRESLVVALAAVAYVIYPVVPQHDESSTPSPRAAIEVPPDFDEEALGDTIGFWRSNFFAVRSDMREHLASAASGALVRTRGRPKEDAVQEAVQAVDLIHGGATPGLILHIVSTGEVPKAAELLFGVRTNAEKRTLVENMRLGFGELKRVHSQGLYLETLAARIEADSGDHDHVAGMRGEWLPLVNDLLPLLPPEVALAIWYGRPRDALEKTALAMKRAVGRHAKRDSRERKRVVYLDEPRSQDEGSSLHEVIADQAWDVESQAALNIDGVLTAIRLTDRERQVTKLRLEGYSPADVARELCISRVRVSEILKAIRERRRAQDD